MKKGRDGTVWPRRVSLKRERVLRTEGGGGDDDDGRKGETVAMRRSLQRKQPKRRSRELDGLAAPDGFAAGWGATERASRRASTTARGEESRAAGERREERKRVKVVRIGKAETEAKRMHKVVAVGPAVIARMDTSADTWEGVRRVQQQRRREEAWRQEDG